MHCISAFAVVVLHINGELFWSFNKERYWIMGNIIDCIFYFAVPVFFMITGATLLDYPKRYGLKEYVKNKIIKIFHSLSFLCESGSVTFLFFKFS